MTKTKEITKKENPALRFTNKVVKEFTGGDHTIALTNFQKRLVQNYFIALNSVLAKAEAGRLKKSEKWRDKVPVTWENVNMEKLVQDVVAVARIGYDPAQKNHINMIPYKNNTTKLYDIGFIEGYRGLELKGMKYGLDVPDTVIVHLVYSSDEFTPIMKDLNNRFDSYEFKVVNPFDRGEIIGGFYYHFFAENFSKNKLVMFTLEEIEKRKPRYAAPEFWGGEKPIWKDGKKTGKMEPVEGWPKEMKWKTIYRAAYNDITIDSQKIDADYLRMKEIEGSVAEHEIQKEIDEKANKEFIDIGSSEVVDAEFAESATNNTAETPQPSPDKTEPGKDTSAPIDTKKTPEPQGDAPRNEVFGAENPIDTALRTGKEEKKQKQAEPKARPKYVAELYKWLDGVKPELREACLMKIKEESSFLKLCVDDRDKVAAHYNELMESQGDEQRETEHPECEF